MLTRSAERTSAGHSRSACSSPAHCQHLHYPHCSMACSLLASSLRTCKTLQATSYRTAMTLQWPLVATSGHRRQGCSRVRCPGHMPSEVQRVHSSSGMVPTREGSLAPKVPVRGGTSTAHAAGCTMTRQKSARHASRERVASMNTRCGRGLGASDRVWVRCQDRNDVAPDGDSAAAILAGKLPPSRNWRQSDCTRTARHCKLPPGSTEQGFGYRTGVRV